MEQSCELCFLEIKNEAYVVTPNLEGESVYHFTCFLIIQDSKVDLLDYGLSFKDDTTEDLDFLDQYTDDNDEDFEFEDELDPQTPSAA